MPLNPMMAKVLSLIFLFLIAATAVVSAQTFEKYRNKFREDQQRHGQIVFIGGLGNSSYLGDLKTSEFSLDTKHNLIIGAKYRYKTHLSFRSELTWYRISGSDARQPVESGLPSRNLSFRADNIELNFAGLLHAFPRYKSKRDLSPVIANPYIFLGLGATSNNPTAEYEGRRYNLRKLQTQGIRYSGAEFVIPFGLGIDFRINNNFDIGLEGGYRLTFTDQLDDSSRPEMINLDLFSNPIAAALHDRRGEVGDIPGVPPYSGSIRGNPKNNDSYFLISAKVQYYIPMTGVRRAKYQGSKESGSTFKGTMKRKKIRR
ncbi:MAG: porin family protein [Bacteroidota bacterium]|nr:porin family protein [Bacteroidota bacterium]